MSEMVDVFGQPSSNSGSGYEITASSTYSSYYPYLGFGSGSGRIWGNQGFAPAWLRYKFTDGSKYIIKSLSFTPYTDVSGRYLSTTSMTLQGSNDDFETYDTLYVFSSSSHDRVTVSLAGNISYSDFRFNITNSSGYAGLREIVAEGIKEGPSTYTIHFDGNGGIDYTGTMTDQTMPVDEDTNIKFNRFTKTGYRFLGWDTSSTATTVVYTNGQSVRNLTVAGGTINLYVVWELSFSYILEDDAGKYYSVSQSGINQQLIEITGISELTGAVFLAEGSQVKPSGLTLMNMDSPKIHLWQGEEAPETSAYMKAQPSPQIILTVIDFSKPSITGIKSMEANYDYGDNGNITVFYSVNGGSSYIPAGTIEQFLAMNLDTLYSMISTSLYLRIVLWGDARFTSFKMNFKRRGIH